MTSVVGRPSLSGAQNIISQELESLRHKVHFPKRDLAELLQLTGVTISRIVTHGRQLTLEESLIMYFFFTKLLKEKGFKVPSLEEIFLSDEVQEKLEAYVEKFYTFST